MFASLAPRKGVVVDFDGGELVTDAGVRLLCEVDLRLRLTERLAACLVDPRDPAMVIHDLQTMSTLCRFENRATRSTCVRLNDLLVDLFIESFEEPPEEVTLDFDSTDDPVHGNQEKRFFHGYQHHDCFLPLYVVCGEQVLCAYLRPSRIDDARHSRAVLKLIADKLRATRPQDRIVVRADSGFCRWRLMRWCDRHDIRSILGLARNPRLGRLIEAFAAESQRQFELTGVKQRRFHDREYAAQSWDRSRRVIVKAEHLPGGRNLRYVVTNLEGEAQRLHDEVYCQRGDMENRLKEQQLGLFADRTSCTKFIANQFRVLLGAAAHTLLQTLRRTALAGTELAKAQVWTIRLKLLKIAARVKVSVRRVVISLARSHPSLVLFRLVAERLRGRRLTPE